MSPIVRKFCKYTSRIISTLSLISYMWDCGTVVASIFTLSLISYYCLWDSGTAVAGMFCLTYIHNDYGTADRRFSYPMLSEWPGIVKSLPSPQKSKVAPTPTVVSFSRVLLIMIIYLSSHVCKDETIWRSATKF